MSGIVHLVGAGPGAADLLTLRAARLLARADIVFHDALVGADILAMAPQAEKVFVGKRCGAHSASQRFINKRLIEAARRHAVVVRLKGGDPMLFGRAQEELDALARAGVGVEVVPGVTAALAASAQLGVSLTRRGLARSVAFVTPRVGAGRATAEWAHSVAAADTAALYMAAGEADALRQALLAAGMPPGTPAVLVEQASLESAQTLFASLSDLPEAGRRLRGGPVLVLLGEVYRERLNAAQSASSPKPMNHSSDHSAIEKPRKVHLTSAH